MAVEERSAGIVVYHDSPQHGRRFLLLDYGRHWDFAKGHVEPGESDMTAAHRELKEETGLTACILCDGFTKHIDYQYRSRRGKLMHKTVVFFTGRIESDDVMLSEEHVGFEWLPYDAAMQRLTFQNARSVLSAAHDHLQKHGI